MEAEVRFLVQLSEDARGAIVDEEHLRLLAIGQPSGTHVAPPDGLLHIFAVVLGMLIVAGWAFGGLTIYVGRCFKRRVRRTLTFVVACLNTLFIVLSRPSVKRLYS